MAKREEDYVYLPLVDARKAINVKVSLFAVVVEIGGATRSKGTGRLFFWSYYGVVCVAEWRQCGMLAGDVGRTCLTAGERKVFDCDCQFV